MKVDARGWGRNCGKKTIISANLHDRPSDSKIYPDEVVVNKADEGLVEVWWGKSITLNGRYFFSMTLNREDIARLFVEAFSDADLDTILGLLGSAREQAAIHANEPKDNQPVHSDG
jgi:hypothetical protein